MLNHQRVTATTWTPSGVKPGQSSATEGSASTIISAGEGQEDHIAHAEAEIALELLGSAPGVVFSKRREQRDGDSSADYARGQLPEPVRV
jgi:hypothetical protein